MDELTLPYDILRFDYKERLEDRFLATHLHRFEMFHQPVAIAIVIEIINPWHPTSEYCQKIINNIVREFLRSDGQSFLVRFETSLKNVNRIVEEASAKLETTIACAAILIEENQVHCAGIGGACLGLYRNDRLSSIISTKSGQKTFSSVTSGDLRQNDWLVLANTDFYTEIEGSSSQLWNDLPGEFRDKLVTQKLVQPQAVWAGLLFRYNQETPTENQTTFWEESHRLTSTRLPKISLPSNFNWRPNWSGAKLMAFFTPLVATTNTWVRNWFTKIKWPKLSRLPKLSTQSAKRLIPILIIIFVILAGVTTGYRRAHRHPVAVTVAPTLVTEINALSPDNLLTGLLAKFTVSTYQHLGDNDKKILATTLLKQNIVLTDLPAAITAAPNPIVAIDILNGEPILVDNQGQVWLYKNNLLSKVTQKQLIPNPISLTALAENNIIVSDSTGNIWRLTGAADSPVVLVGPKTLPTTAKLVSSYLGNLYIAVTDLKITFRVVSFTDSLATAAIYNKGDTLPVTAINDLAINGNLVAADNTGKIADFTKGKLGTVAITLSPFDGAVHLTASDKNPLIAVASGRLIYLLNQTGTVQKTIFFASDTKVSDLALDSTAPNLLWVIFDRELYKLTLP